MSYKFKAKLLKILVVLFLSIPVVLVIFLFGLFFDLVSYQPEIKIPYLESPLQTEISDKEKMSLFFVKRYKDYDIVISPQARYKIHARILSKCPYFFDMQAYLAPYDLALGWGRYAVKENYSKVAFFQFGRWYYYYYPSFEFSDVGDYSSNNHILYANDNILKGIKKIKKHDEVYMEGYLVDIEAVNSKGNQFVWNTSLSRDDSGDGACEVFYVTKIVSKYGIFE